MDAAPSLSAGVLIPRQYRMYVDLYHLAIWYCRPRSLVPPPANVAREAVSSVQGDSGYAALLALCDFHVWHGANGLTCRQDSGTIRGNRSLRHDMKK